MQDQFFQLFGGTGVLIQELNDFSQHPRDVVEQINDDEAQDVGGHHVEPSLKWLGQRPLDQAGAPPVDADVIIMNDDALQTAVDAFVDALKG